MGWKATLRAMEAANRRQQRESQRRLRELEQRAKEQAKLSAIEQARLEVETFENHLDGLLSIHKEQSEIIDWEEFAASLPPPDPQRKSYYELRTKQHLLVLPPNLKENTEIQIEQAQTQDERLFQVEVQNYYSQKAKWEKLKDLSRRVLSGEHKAYIEALVEFNPFAEMSDLGSSINFIVHSAKLIECILKINGRQAIPAEVKTLTAGGKVSIKPMPKGRFHEIYCNLFQPIYGPPSPPHFSSRLPRRLVRHSPKGDGGSLGEDGSSHLALAYKPYRPNTAPYRPKNEITC
jgi:hypothetical protein